MMRPVVKWAGSKRRQAPVILQYAPPEYGTYYEPFVGGASILYALHPERAVAGDICMPLITLWQTIQTDPHGLADAYRERWLEIQRDGAMAYDRIRARFNRLHDPADLLTLTRTCANGLPRFNKRGEFNNSFHHGRPDIHPDRLAPILTDWATRIHGADFQAGDYETTTCDATAGDLMYLDPPYAHTNGMYYGGIDQARLFGFLDGLNRRGVLWMMSYDGSHGGMDMTTPVPAGLYARRIIIPNGTSPFSRTNGHGNIPVTETLYFNYGPAGRISRV